MKIIGNIRQAIEEHGSIPISQFMDEAMYNINEGYYINSNPIGASGDFITSPEISQLFGEMLGIYCAIMWDKMGKPKKFSLVELGPGKATLMDDLLRGTKNIKGFHQACDIHLVERNKRLIKSQELKLQSHNLPVKWHKSVYDLPKNQPIIIIANEFFDCLPINQYIRYQDIWYEQSVALHGTEFEIVKSPISMALSDSLTLEHPNSIDFSILEICYPAIEIIQHLCSILKLTPGCLLIVDYGYEYDPHKRIAYNSTLQAVKNHKFHPIFKDIGRADITAHVDFYALKETAKNNDCKTIGTINQGDFLEKLGINIRAEILKKSSSAAEAESIESGLNRLINPKQMGNLFKTLIVHSKNLDHINL